MLWGVIRAIVRDRTALAREKLALRQQVAVLKRNDKKPKLRTRDRVFWVFLSRLWRYWRQGLIPVKPETVVKWHRRGFRLFWHWKSKSDTIGRPPLDAEIRKRVRRNHKAMLFSPGLQRD